MLQAHLREKTFMTKIRIALLVLTAGTLSGSQVAYAGDPAHTDQAIVPPAKATSRLKEGNGRYTSGNQQHPHESSEERAYIATNSYENAGMLFLGMTAAEAAKRRAELTKSQHPFAIIVSCSDSRVPPEIVFDQGLGDLFVLRVAGNVIDDHSLGSIEYGVDHLMVRLTRRQKKQSLPKAKRLRISNHWSWPSSPRSKLLSMAISRRP